MILCFWATRPSGRGLGTRVKKLLADKEEILDVPGQTVQRLGTATLLNK